MGNVYLSGLNKKVVSLGESKVAKIPETLVTAYYVEGKDLVNKDARKKMLFENAVNKAFETRSNVIFENSRKAVADADAKLGRTWEASAKGAEDLTKIVHSMGKSVADVAADMQKKLLMAAKITIEESRGIASVTGQIVTATEVSLDGKVTESSEAKGAAGAAADSAEARGEIVDASNKLVGQIETDLRHALAAAQKGHTFLDESEDCATRAAGFMKEFAKSQGVKEAVVLKATTLNMTKHLKATGDHLTDALSLLWEAQRRLGLVEKAVKPLKVATLAGELKACEAAMDKAEKPLEDWTKAKSVVEGGAKPWDGKSVREYGKLAVTLKTIAGQDVAKLIKGALDTVVKLGVGIEAARKEA